MKPKAFAILGVVLVIGGAAFYAMSKPKSTPSNGLVFNTSQDVYDYNDILNYSIKTVDEETYSFGSDYIIEHFVDNEWKVYNDLIPSTMELNYVNKDSEYTFKREIKISDVIKDPGHYRLYKTVININTEEAVEITAEFSVK